MTSFPKALERMPSIRQSDAATFDRCALSFHLDKLHRQGWGTDRAASGHIFHRFATKALREMHARGEGFIPGDVASAILLETLAQRDVDRTCEHIGADGRDCGKPIVKRYMSPPTPEEAERGAEVGFPRVTCAAGHDHRSEFVNIPEEQVKDLRWIVVKWANEMAFDIANLVSVEERLTAKVRYPDPAGGFVERVVSGKLDALFVADGDEEAIVLDWKDTWALPAPTELNFDGYFQQRFYALLVLANYPSIKRVTLREVYVRKSEVREGTVWRDDLEDVLATVSALVERMDRSVEDDVYPPSPGIHCLFCPRPGACPIFPDLRREGALTDPEDARRWAREAVVAESALKQRKMGLEAVAGVKGPVEVSTHKGRRAWAHKDGLRTRRPSKREIRQAVELYGREVDLDRYFRTEAYTKFGLHEVSAHPPTDEQDAELDHRLMAALEQSAEAVRPRE